MIVFVLSCLGLVLLADFTHREPEDEQQPAEELEDVRLPEDPGDMLAAA